MRSLLRILVRTPVSFSAPTILGLALAIGVTTAVFSVFSAMLLRSMGFQNPRQIVALWRTDEAHGQKSVEISYGDLTAWRKDAGTFEGISLLSSVNLDFPIRAGDVPEHVDGTTVSGNFFDVVGATPLAGRLFTAEDDTPASAARVVISYRLWHTRFGGDYGVIGREIQVGPRSATVIGIAREEFDFPRNVDLWVPLHAAWPEVDKSPNERVFSAVARLKPGISIEQARARMNVMARQPGSLVRFGVLVTPILDEIYGAARTAIEILLASVFLVLLIACANAANLLLNRAAERSRELAVRAALGASRGQLVSLLVRESMALAALAGMLGVALAAGGVKLLVWLAPTEVPRIDQASLDFPVLAFGMVVTFATVLLFGVGPAFVAANRDANDALKESGRGTAGNVFQGRLRGFLIVSEVALSVILLFCAGSLLRSFQKLAAIDPGFHAERILTFRVTLDNSTQESRRAMYNRILDRMRALPGVESAAAVLIRPLSGAVGWDTTYSIEGEPAQPKTPYPNGNYEAVSPDYFRTMGIRLLAGRDFASTDTAGSAGVVIIDEGTARRHWPAGDAIGRQIRMGGAKSPWLKVVGVVGQVRYREWESARPDFYVPYTQRAQHRTDFVIKTRNDPWSLAEAVRLEVFAIDKNQPISNLTTMETLVDHALARSRFNSAAMTVLAASALLLAGIGIYGVLSYAVTQRTAEIALRAALGATPLNVGRMIAWDGMRLVVMGLGAGLLGAMWARSLLSAILFRGEATDVATYALAAFAILGFAVAACAGPAFRAAAVEPARVLR